MNTTTPLLVSLAAAQKSRATMEPQDATIHVPNRLNLVSETILPFQSLYNGVASGTQTLVGSSMIYRQAAINLDEDVQMFNIQDGLWELVINHTFSFTGAVADAAAFAMLYGLVRTPVTSFVNNLTFFSAAIVQQQAAQILTFRMLVDRGNQFELRHFIENGGGAGTAQSRAHVIATRLV